MTLLIIPDEVTQQAYTVVGAQTAFPFTFAVFTKADLHFSVAGVELPQSGFTLSGTALDGGGYQGGTVNLVTPVSATTCLLWRETVVARTTNFSPSPSVPIRDIDVAYNRLTAVAQDLRRDLNSGGLAIGATGVASVNGHVGVVTLAASDLGAISSAGGTFTGAVLGVTAGLGDNTTKLATTAWVTTALAAVGGGVSLATTGTPANLGTAALGVAITAARADHVHNLPSLTTLGAAPNVLTTKGDLYTFGSAPLRQPVGASAQILVADPAQTSGLNWVNLDWSIVLGKPTTFTPSAHTHVYSDITNFGAGVNASLAAGTGVTLTLSGGVTTITSSGSGGLPVSYTPAYENGIRTSNSASTNTTNLNALIASLFSAGGGTIWCNQPGALFINGQITLKSGVNIKCQGGSQFSWSGGTTGNIFASSISDVLIGCDIDILVDEGASFSGVVFNLHSAQYNRIRIHALGNNTGSVFTSIVADSTAGQWAGGGRNTAFNYFEFFHRFQCGYGCLIQGIPASGSTFGGQVQVVTLNTFYNCQFSDCAVIGFRIEMWADSNTFTGNTYTANGGAGSVGFLVNQGRTNNGSVYNTTIDQLATDMFGTIGGRYGVVFNESKGMKIGLLLSGPTLENGSFVGANCTSYQVLELVNSGSSVFGSSLAAADTLYMHQKGYATGL